MSLAIAKNMRSLAADGYFGKKDLEAAVTSMLDGKGVTCTEKQRFEDQFDKLVSDKGVRVTDATKDAFAHFKRRLAEHDCNTDVHAPGLDKDEVKSILSLYVDRSRAHSGGESSGGSRTAPARPTSSRRASRGGE